MSCDFDMRRTLLHLLVQTDDPLAARIIDEQRKLPDHNVKVVDLTDPDCDYGTVLEEIFQADSLQVW